MISTGLVVVRKPGSPPAGAAEHCACVAAVGHRQLVAKEQSNHGRRLRPTGFKRRYCGREEDPVGQ